LLRLKAAGTTPAAFTALTGRRVRTGAGFGGTAGAVVCRLRPGAGAGCGWQGAAGAEPGAGGLERYAGVRAPGHAERGSRRECGAAGVWGSTRECGASDGPGAGGGGGGGGARGGFAGPALPAGTYLVKVTVDGKVIGTKTVVIEADSLQ
jgi:hypothetical protein